MIQFPAELLKSRQKNDNPLINLIDDIKNGASDIKVTTSVEPIPNTGLLESFSFEDILCNALRRYLRDIPGVNNDVLKTYDDELVMFMFFAPPVFRELHDYWKENIFGNTQINEAPDESARTLFSKLLKYDGKKRAGSFTLRDTFEVLSIRANRFPRAALYENVLLDGRDTSATRQWVRL